ncbi:HEAT repeat domain-containing protein [Streptomyces sp. RTGN2]|uniref:HEAT repeat domain-containing protein n=1 Tax=Streptomyces sp. RTGN2 TaxID=3016525 RepID=UPI0025533BBD|nr:HEAT repeat domain-containing protein [Streptomyces sp. RTGN2]
MGFAREELRRALLDLQEAAARKDPERTQATLQLQVRRTGLPGTERFHGQRASEWAAASAEDFRLPKHADVLLAVVAVWLSWTGQRTLESDGRVRREWLVSQAGGRSWRRRYEEATVEASEGRRSREGRGGLSARTDAAIGEYLQRLVQTHGRLNMDVLGEAGRAGEQQQIGLGTVFEEPLLAWDWPRQPLSQRLVRDLMGHGELDERDATEVASLSPGAGRPQHTRVRHAQPVLDVLGSQDGRRLVVLGDPGAGKTMLAKYLALALAGGLDTVPDGLDALKDAVPVVVELRWLADPRWIGATVEEYWAEHNAAERMGLPREVLEDLLADRQRPVVMVFDGLDEVFDPARRADIARQVAAFAQSHPDTRVVVTSRIVGFAAGEFARADFGIAKLENLSRAQVESFIDRWYAAAHPDSPGEAARLARRLTDAVRDFPSVAELAGNPLLLAILTAIGLGASIPRDRKDVYEHAVVVLASRWDRDAKHLHLPRHAHPDVAHAIEELDGRILQELLERIASHIQEGADSGNPSGGGDSPLISVNDLEQAIRDFVCELGYSVPVGRTVARAMIERLHERAFLIHPFGAGAYGFVHRTFLEYLAARDLAHRYRQWSEETLLDQLMERVVNPSWREVVLLFLGMISRDAETLHARFIARLLKLHRHSGGPPLFLAHGDTTFLDFALQALAEAHRIGRPPAGPSISPEQAEASLALQSDAVIDAVIAELAMFPGIDFPRARAVLRDFPGSWSGRERFRRWLWPHLATAGLAPAGHNAARIGLAMSRDAAEALAIARVTWNEAGVAAVRALNERWSDEPRVKATIFAIAQGTGVSPAMQSEALRAVAQRYANDDNARTLILDVARGVDTNSDSQGAALLLLAEHWPSEPESRQTVLEAADGTNTNTDLRALRALALYWVADPEAQIRLLRAAQDARSSVRSGTWEALGKGWPADAEFRRLAVAAMDDRDLAVRKAAGAFLGNQWSQDAEARSAVFTAVRTAGYDEQLFRIASQYWPADREVRQILFAVAREATRSVTEVGAAVAQLGAQWPKDPEVRQLIFELAHHADPKHRWNALETMTASWPKDDEVRRTVIAAAGEVSPTIRAVALEFAGWEWSGDLELRAALMAGVRDSDPDVRWFALESIAQQWPQDSEVRHVVLAAVDDSDITVRRTAVEALAEQWPECPEAQQAVLAAVGDPESEVRAIALRMAGDYWPGHEEVRAAALQAVNDAEPWVALTALEVLAQQWQEDAETRSVVERCVDGALHLHALRLLALVWPRDAATLRTVERVAEGEPTHAVTASLLAFLAGLRDDTPDAYR